MPSLLRTYRSSIALIGFGVLIIVASTRGGGAGGSLFVEGRERDGPRKRTVIELGHCDVGRIIGDAQASHVFEYTNPGPETWSLEGIDGTCGCVDVMEVTEEVKPGCVLRVAVTASSRGRTLSHSTQKVYIRMSPNLLFEGRVDVEVVPDAYVLPSGGQYVADEGGNFEARAQLGLPALDGMRISHESLSGVGVQILEPQKNGISKERVHPIRIHGRLMPAQDFLDENVEIHAAANRYESVAVFRLVVERRE